MQGRNHHFLLVLQNPALPITLLKIDTYTTSHPLCLSGPGLTELSTDETKYPLSRGLQFLLAGRPTGEPFLLDSQSGQPAHHCTGDGGQQEALQNMLAHTNFFTPPIKPFLSLLKFFLL